MKDFKGKIAFITGGASGAGLGQAKVFAKAGMRVVIADIRLDALHNAVSEIVSYAGCNIGDILPLCFDLTDRKAYIAAADSVEKVFGGPPHLLIQTAGVNSFGPVEASEFDDFDWVVSVCFDHVVNGLVIFVPRMIRAYGGKDGVPKEEFHIAATSSAGAFGAGPVTGPYSAAKAAVNNLMYSYAVSLRIYGAGVTVLCPFNINSNIGNSERYRPDHLRHTGYHVSDGTMAALSAVHAEGIDPIELAEILKEGIENRRIIVLPFRDFDEWTRTLDGYHKTESDYMLTEFERNKNAPPPQDFRMTVPKGAEPFGGARKDLDYIDPSKNPKY